MELTEFLLARIGEDEDVARAAIGKRVDISAIWSDAAVSRHIDRWSSARVLAECKAKREAIEEAWADHLRIEGEWGDCRSQAELSAIHDNPYVLRALAAVYDDHPDYDPAWRP